MSEISDVAAIRGMARALLKKANALAKGRKFLIKTWYKNYGYGSPGWNAGIKILDAEKDAEIAYADWPMVNGPVCIGFRDINTAKEAYSKLKDGEYATWKEVGKYL